jgi:hypothetical protein
MTTNETKNIRQIKSIKKKIAYIFSDDYIPSCHPSREEDIKTEDALILLADQIDLIWTIVKAYKTEKL